MDSILEKLFEGDIQPQENFKPSNPQYFEVSKSLSDLIEKYQKAMTKDEFEDLEKLIEMLCSLHTIENTYYFSKGIKLGAKLMVEVLNDI